MAEITEGEIKETFGDKTFYKGLDYYDGRRVLDTVRIGSILYARVVGSSAKPYEVTASISEMHTECTCPVGSMCNLRVQ
ncbi:MAG: hypothetical protein FIB08_05790 [Candidatus Methanoperedens sp.]|nr:hypothetical protein [Candidatus Methanoperedens sp.]